MSGATVLAAGSILDHLAPRYVWHWPGFEVDLAGVNRWVEHRTGVNPDITTHVVMLGCAALATTFLMLLVAHRNAIVPRGIRNFFEPVLIYVRDQMVYPWLGEHAGRIYLPYFWTAFFFILICNLIGLLPAPFGITATGNFNVTGAMAVLTLVIGMVGGMVKKGALGWFLGLVPPGVPKPLYALILPIEIMGMLTKHAALMIRLAANMTAGHAILAVLALWTSLAPALLPVRAIQAGGSAAMVCFEIFIALVQAYVFTTLSAIFIGLSLAEEH